MLYKFNGNFSKKQVLITEVTSSRKIDGKLEKACAKRWTEIVNKARADKKRIWNGSVYRFESIRVTNKKLFFKVSTLPFSIRLAMNDFTNQVIGLGQKYAPMGMYTSCFVISSDEYYIFIEKSDKYYTTRKACFVGGVLSKRNKGLKGGVDLFKEAEKEITEETGIKAKNIKTMILNGGYVSENSNFCLVFLVTIDLSFAQIKKSFKSQNDGEAKSLIGVRKNKLAKFTKLLPEKDVPKFQILRPANLLL